MPLVKSLVFGLVVLGVSGTQASAAATRWWVWSRAWKSSEIDRTRASMPTILPVNPPTSSPARPSYWAPSHETTLYAGQGYWAPFTQPAYRGIPVAAPSRESSSGSSWDSGVRDRAASSAAYGISTLAAPAPSYDYDARVNLGSGPYPAESMLTVGGATPWYESPVVQKVFGGVPNGDQRAAFTGEVLQRAEQAFEKSGVTNIALTADPNASAAHTLSVVSGTSYGPNPDAVGITNMGGDGFSFIDKLSYADSVDELEWAVAHNVAHELMHAFGVDHHDSTGDFLDSATTPWEVLVDPNTVFGPTAVDDLLAENFRQRYDTGGALALGAQGLAHGGMTIHPSPVPEPTTVALWGFAVAAALAVHRVRDNRSRRRAA